VILARQEGDGCLLPILLFLVDAEQPGAPRQGGCRSR